MVDQAAHPICPRCGRELTPLKGASPPRFYCPKCRDSWPAAALSSLHAAAQALSPAERAARLNADFEAAIKHMMQGVGLLVIGGIITGGTYLLARSGGVYFVTSGAILLGIVRLVMGGTQFVQTKKAIKTFRSEVDSFSSN